MKVVFLGTGTSQGVPIIGCGCEVCRSLDYRDKRLRTSAYIEVGDKRIVIDTGPDFRQQMLRESIAHLDAVLFTHAHRDHTAGLDDIRAFNFIQEMDIPAYATVDVLRQLQTDFEYIFSKQHYFGLPRLELHEIGSLPFSIGDVPVTPLPVMHLRLPVTGFRIGNFSYITDANHIPDTTVDLLKGTSVLVLNALQITEHLSHFNLEQALQMVSIIKPRRAYFTHISHKLGLHSKIEKLLPPNVQLAYDGLEIQTD
ncbi:MAG TPA: MBL fold metallo-hydrolase [Chryseolinea sp.]|nr:MBL fold metallo-hydrolase [Chryseolinea sp.]